MGDEHTRRLRFIPIWAGVSASKSPMNNYLTDSEYAERIRPPTAEEVEARRLEQEAEAEREKTHCRCCGREYEDE